MNPEAQRIAIAEECGWTDCHKSLASNQEKEPHERCPIGIPPKSCVHRRLPDYLNDLNACHEFEKTLTPGQFDNYREHLMNDCLQRGSSPWVATAAQRSEAFLRALGKWTE
jgi:hypothetical protein